MDPTLNDLAKKYNAQIPTLRARLKKLEKDNPEQKLSYKIENVIYLTPAGLNRIEQGIIQHPINKKKPQTKAKKRSKQTVKGEISNAVEEVLKDEIKLLKQQLEGKDRELAGLYKQIERLTGIIEDQNRTLSQSLNESHALTSQAQTLNAIETIEKIMPEPMPEMDPDPIKRSGRKKGILSKLIIATKVFKGDYD